jgi:hypothetical protein
VDFLAIKVSPQQASHVVTAVSKRFPFQASLSHLKRVRRCEAASLEILVCPLSDSLLSEDGRGQPEDQEAEPGNEPIPADSIPPEVMII